MLKTCSDVENALAKIKNAWRQAAESLSDETFGIDPGDEATTFQGAVALRKRLRG